MQVGVGKATAKNHPGLRGRGSVVDDLLNERTAVRYVAARLSDIRTQLRAWLATQGATLSADAERDMLALGYNIGWKSLRDRNLKDTSFGADVPARVAHIRRSSNYLTHTTAHYAVVEALLK